MKFLVHLLWKVLVPLNRADAAALSSNLFNPAGGKSFVRRLGGDFAIERAPVVLSPTDLFHAGLKPIRRALGLEGSRFPYIFRSKTGTDHQSVNIAIQLHEGALCLTVRLAPFFATSTSDWLPLQDLRQHPVLWPLTKRVLDLAVTGDSSTRYGREPQVLPAMHIRAVELDPSDWSSQLVSVVTRHDNVNEKIVNDVLKKNQTHRIDQTLLLVDKQGIAAYVPSLTSDAAANGNLNRFEQAAAMLQLAGALRINLRSKLGVATDATRAILDPNSAITASVSGRHIWELLVKEFSLVTLLQSIVTTSSLDNSLTQMNSVPTPSTPPLAALTRVLLITVTKVETRALSAAIIAATGRGATNLSVNGFTYRDFGRFGEYQLINQISGMGAGGLDGSHESVRRGIQAIEPGVILMVGIAFGVDSKAQPVGTILVSKQIQCYDLQRINSDSSITLRGDKVTASPRLLNWVSHAEIDWPDESAKIKKGLILCGEKLIDNEEYRKKIINLAPEAIGGEMEGAGLYAASQNHSARIDWLVVKAVCDWADGNKQECKDQLQATAAKSAAEFCIHMLRTNSAVPV